ncbi:MAG: hypothetical protein ACFFBC_15325 [Promethearchaeota archaeon]
MVSIPISYYVAILDFEGNPVFMVEIIVYNTLFSFYIEDYEYKVDLYLFLMRIFSTFKNIVYFTFNNHEKEEIKKISQYLECPRYRSDKDDKLIKDCS